VVGMVESGAACATGQGGIGSRGERRSATAQLRGSVCRAVGPLPGVAPARLAGSPSEFELHVVHPRLACDSSPPLRRALAACPYDCRMDDLWCVLVGHGVVRAGQITAALRSRGDLAAEIRIRAGSGSVALLH